ncbi:uncharacterized protein LOC111253054 isoform X2 [Varroa destructor]|uniref:Uncharacterized protein n=1 Tax=Varroa destructor TaxID=109461 RepID=A0A7M7KNE4_VARDE|nr:uncharacterized protein LOC111253054 isoform X2 [Varroa destructor]
MHGRRSIIKKRDDDEVTLTRPLNKRVSFSVSNQTRVFSVDSDESKQTTFGGDCSSVSLGEMSTLHDQQSSLHGTCLMDQESFQQRNLSKRLHSSNSTLDGLPDTSALMEMSLSSTPSQDRNDEDAGWLDDEEISDTEHSKGPLDGECTEVAAKDDDEESVIMTNVSDQETSGQSNAALKSEAVCPSLTPPEEPTRRKSSEQEDKTHPVELCDEKTGPVREELRKVAEGLLPAETRPDIYGIKAALQGRAERKRNNVNINPVHEYTFANNTITGIRFSNIMPDETMAEELSRRSPSSEENSKLYSINRNRADESRSESVYQSLPPPNLSSCIDPSETFIEKNPSANEASTADHSESADSLENSTCYDDLSKLNKSSHRNRSNTAYNAGTSLMQESVVTASMSIRNEFISFNCTDIETMNCTDVTEDNEHYEEDEHETATDDIEYHHQDDATRLNESQGSFAASTSAIISGCEELDEAQGPSRMENASILPIYEATSATVSDEEVRANDCQNVDETSALIGTEKRDETAGKRRTFILRTAEKCKEDPEISGSDKDTNDSRGSKDNSDDLQDRTCNDTLSQPGFDRQLDVSGVQPLDEIEAPLIECDPSNEWNHTETTFTKGRLSYRECDEAGKRDRLLKIGDRSALNQTKVGVGIANETYSIARSPEKPASRDDEVSLLHDEPEIPGFHDCTDIIFGSHFGETSGRTLSDRSGVSPFGTPLSQRTNLNNSIKPTSLATKQNFTEDQLLAEFPELFKGITMLSPKKLPPVTSPVKVHVKYGMDAAALKRTLVPEENTGYQENLRRQLDKMRSEQDGFKALLSRVNEFLVRAKPWPLINKAQLEEVAPHQDIYVECNFETRSASVRIDCRELPRGDVQGEIVDCTETDPHRSSGGLFALAPLVVTWTRRALVRNCEGTVWRASSWSDAELKIRSAIEVLEANWASFKGVEFWLKTDTALIAGKKRVSFGGVVWRCRQVRVFIDADLQVEFEVGQLEGDCNPKDFELKMDELHEAWMLGDDILNFRKRVNAVHTRTLELAAERTIEKFKNQRLEKFRK